MKKTIYSARANLVILVLLFLSAYSLGFADAQWYLNWGNTLFHYLGGFFIGMLIASYYANEFARLSQPFKFFALVGIAIGVGVFWEFHEWILNQTLTNYTSSHGYQMTFIGDLSDTMADLALDTLGAMTAAIIWMFK